MTEQLIESLKGFIPFITCFGGGVILLALFTMFYTLFTPYPEFRLIRQGKTAPAVSLGGAILGFTFPLVAAILYTRSLPEMIMWAVIAMFIQVLVFCALRRIFSGMVKDIQDDRIGPAVFLACLSVAVGLINAACMSY
jgi:putative membrane protein